MTLRQYLNKPLNTLKRVKVLTNASVYLLGNIIQNGANFLLIPLWAHFLLPEDYGITGTAIAYAGVLSSIFLLGLNSSVTRHYYDYIDDVEKQKRYVTNVFVFQVVFSGLLMILANVFGPAIWVRFTGDSFPFDPFMRLVLWTTYMRCWIQIPLSLYRAQQKPRNYIILQLAGSLCESLFIGILIIGYRKGAYGQLLGSAIGSTLVGLGIFFVLWRTWFVRGVSKVYILDAIRYGSPLVPHLLAAYLNNAAGRIILERFVALKELGIYNFGYMLGNTMSMLVDAINMAWAPYYYEIMKTSPDPGPRIKQVLSIYLSGFGFICLVGVLFSNELIHLLFASKYYPSAVYVPPLLFGGFMISVYKFGVNPLFYYKKTTLIPVVTGVSAGLNILLNFLLVPHFGAMATAWITAFVFFMTGLLAFTLSRRYQQMNFPFGRYFIIGGFVLLCTIIMNIFNPDISVKVFLLKVAAIFLYVGVVYLVLYKNSPDNPFSALKPITEKRQESVDELLVEEEI